MAQKMGVQRKSWVQKLGVGRKSVYEINPLGCTVLVSWLKCTTVVFILPRAVKGVSPAVTLIAVLLLMLAAVVQVVLVPVLPCHRGPCITLGVRPYSIPPAHHLTRCGTNSIKI